MTSFETCGLPPFRYHSTPQVQQDGGVSGIEINQTQLEDYLAALREAVCNDIETLESQSGGVNTFLELDDTPDTYVGQQGKLPVVNSLQDALEFFPSTYAGQAGKMVVVAGTEDGLAFQTQPTPSTYFLTPRLSSVWGPNPTSGATGGGIGPAPNITLPGQVQIPVNPANALAATYRQQMTTATTANSQAGIRNSVFLAIRGSAAPMGGFRMVYRFACELFTSGHRGFVGMHPNAAAFPAAASEPSALINILALAFDSTDTNWQIMHNDGSGTATKINLGSGFAVNTTSLLELTLDVEPSGDATYLLRDLSLGTQTSGTISSNLPAGGQPLGVALVANAAATGTNARLTHIFMSLEVGPGES